MLLTKEFTAEFMQQNKGCYSTRQVENTVLKGKKTILLSEILNENIPLKDKYWFCCRKLFTKEQNQQVAIGVAEIVLELFENKYPEDKRPRQAIQAAKDYLNNTITLDELRLYRRAAAAAADAAAYDAAYDAADAADAAYAAAAAAADDADDAAYATADAAYDAAYAYAAYAYAAAAYATAAYDAADAADADAKNLKNTLLIYLINFCKQC